MLFQLLVLLVIMLLTGYLATQGALTALLSFIAAAFASILAAGLYEPLSGPLNSWKPDVGHGVMYLGVFFIAFSALRIASDILVPENIRLPLWIDRAAGGVVGFLAALVVAGTTVIGIEMMPVGTALIPGIDSGYNRFPNGIRTPREMVWLNPDGFVEWLYDMTCGRSLGSAGGKYTFEQAHPDLREELWGYRNRVMLASPYAQRPDLMDVPGAWFVANPDAAWPGAKESFPFEEGRALVVRTDFERGVGEKVSGDPDGKNFRASASQIRLVAINASGVARQYYPVGYLDHGPAAKRYLRYEPLGAFGHVVMDFPIAESEKKTISGTDKILIEWVFAVPEGFTPNFVEVKALARKELTLLDKEAPLASAVYPSRPWLDKPFKVTLALNDDSVTPPASLKGRPIYILDSYVKNSVVMSAVVSAAHKLEENRIAAEESSGGWMSTSTEPGAINASQLKQAAAIAREIALKKDAADQTSWEQILRGTVPSAMTNAPSRNVDAVSRYLDGTIKQLLKDSGTLRKTLETNATGQIGPEELGEGEYVAITWYSTPDTIYVWAKTFTAKQKETAALELTTKDRTFPFRVSTRPEKKP